MRITRYLSYPLLESTSRTFHAKSAKRPRGKAADVLIAVAERGRQGRLHLGRGRAQLPESTRRVPAHIGSVVSESCRKRGNGSIPVTAAGEPFDGPLTDKGIFIVQKGDQYLPCLRPCGS